MIGMRRSNDGPPKKMKINLKKHKPTIAEDFLEVSWTKLHATVLAIYNSESVPHNREELYRMVEDICMHKQADLLCTRLANVMESHVTQLLLKIKSSSADRDVFLEFVTNSWLNHCQQMYSIRSIFLSLDQTYILKKSELGSIWEMSLRFFRQHLKQSPQVQHRIIEGFLQLIVSERQGETINHTVCNVLVRMLVALQLYDTEFLTRFLNDTKAYYKDESSRLLDQMLIPEYLAHVEKRLNEEKQRVVRYLDPGTRIALLKTCEQALLSAHISIILGKGLDGILSEWRAVDASRMYSLLARVAALDDMRKALSEFIRKRGIAMIQNVEDEKNLVKNLLEFRTALEDLLVKSFEKNPDFDKTIMESFEYILNSKENRPAELLAKFIDMQLRSGGGVSESEIETTLAQVVGLFRLLASKDMFEAFYKKDLAKRLLLGKSSSNDLERTMLSKLKAECGSNFTNKLEGMFKDIGISKEHMEAFKKSSEYAKCGAVEVNIHVLTSGHWPLYTAMPNIKLPAILADCQTAFDKFYLSKYDGRKLTWQASLSHCLLGAHINGERKEFQVSLFQSMVLLLFNNAGTISFAEFKNGTGIEEGELKRTLLSLVLGKSRILDKTPQSREVEEADTFCINPKFTSKQFRIKINSLQSKETASEVKETNEKVFADRQYQIDAAIVRIMKARRTLGHQLLIAELMKHLRFTAKPSDLKKRIESLIDREYLERDENDSNVYKYLA